jgi:hypothetical protein
MFTIHATKKLLDRVKPTLSPDPPEPTTALGNWYATAVFWQPQIALLVNETTLLPVLMPLAPAKTLAQRFPTHLGQVLTALDTPPAFITAELDQMTTMVYAKTASRSLTGTMTEFTFLATHHRDGYGQPDDLTALSARLADTPCSPLHKTHISPDRALHAITNHHR